MYLRKLIIGFQILFLNYGKTKIIVIDKKKVIKETKLISHDFVKDSVSSHI